MRLRTGTKRTERAEIKPALDAVVYLSPTVWNRRAKNRTTGKIQNSRLFQERDISRMIVFRWNARSVRQVIADLAANMKYGPASARSSFVKVNVLDQNRAAAARSRMCRKENDLDMG